MNQEKGALSVVFSLDQSFGSLRLLGKKGRGLFGIDLLPSTTKALEQLKKDGARLILVTSEPQSQQSLRLLQQLLPQVERVVNLDKNLSKTLSACSKLLATQLRQIIFVAADRIWRGVATDQGCVAVSHPAIAALVARGCSLQFVRVSGDREHFSRIPEVIPYFLECNEDNSWTLLAVMSRASIAEAVGRRLRVECLPLDISTEDPLLVQLDEIDMRTKTALREQKILLADDRRMLVAMSSSTFNDSFPVHGPHGHLQVLAPSPELLWAAPDPFATSRGVQLLLEQLPTDKLKISHMPIDRHILGVDLSFCSLTAASYQSDVDRYVGVSNLDSSGPIVSRHIRHPDNQRAVKALTDTLNAMGYCAYTHSFNHAGMTLENVIADLPGNGYFRVTPDILQRIRDIFLKYPFPDPPDPWIKAISRLLGIKGLKERNFHGLSPIKLRTTLETIFGLRPWFPWWLHMPVGIGSQLVIVGCHLDSTAASDSGYDPATDPAPGADDDASGIAATLEIARFLSNFRRRLTHTVRFCFFNAEESGLVGSKAYVAMLKAWEAPIKAAICTDMIGYNSDAARIFEIHAGYTDSSVRDASVPIADSIAAWTNCLGSLAPAQIYKGTSSMVGADRNLYDGAINRSDHAAFHEQSYPAVVVSEDFFVNLPSEPGADPNPNYHKAGDTIIDSAFGNDITRAIALAVIDLASDFRLCGQQ